MDMPEESNGKAIALGAAFGALSEIPGLGGIAGGIQAAVAAAARAKDEDWWAMVAARVSAIEDDLGGGVVRYDDPEFLAAVYRLTRAAQETSDDAKRRAYAGILANSGSWSSVPSDERERYERLVREISGRDVLMLAIFRDPRAWLQRHDPTAVEKIEAAIASSIGTFVQTYVAGADPGKIVSARRSIAELESRGLVAVPLNGMMTGAGVLASRITPLGNDLLGFIGEVAEG